MLSKGKINTAALTALSLVALLMTSCGKASAPDHDLTAPLVRMSPPAYSQPGRAENDVDRSIRMQLGKLFAEEPGLKDHRITVDVENGNVTLKGDVDSEVQRRKARDIAMDVPGVRSVANAVRVSE